MYREALGADPPLLSELGFDAASLCLQPLLKEPRPMEDPEDFRNRILSAWRIGGGWEGVADDYPPLSGRTCRTWIYSPPGADGGGWTQEETGTAGGLGC
jgi:hypothetical protein